MVYRNNTGRLGCWLHQFVLRNTLAGSKTVVSTSRNHPVSPYTFVFAHVRLCTLVRVHVSTHAVTHANTQSHKHIRAHTHARTQTYWSLMIRTCLKHCLLLYSWDTQDSSNCLIDNTRTHNHINTGAAAENRARQCLFSFERLRRGKWIEEGGVGLGWWQCV